MTKKLKTKRVRLKTTEIKALRDKLIKKEKLCPILKVGFKGKVAISPALDHCHLLGDVRGVIGTNANTVLGRIEKAYYKWLQKHTDLSLLEVLKNYVEYLEREPLPYEHPEYRASAKRRVRRWKDSTLVTKIEAAGGEVPEGITRRKLVDLYLDVVKRL